MKTLASLLGGRLELLQGDITGYEGEAIVNAANSGLLGGGGVDGAIHRAGGSEILAACKRLRETSLPGGLPTGQAVLTTAGRLPFRGLIHTVGPVWRGGGEGEAGLLAEAYRRSLELAALESFRSLAFPAISTGVYGYPKAEAARIAYRVVADFLAGSKLPERVSLVFYSAADAEAFLEALKFEPPRR